MYAIQTTKLVVFLFTHLPLKRKTLILSKNFAYCMTLCDFSIISQIFLIRCLSRVVLKAFVTNRMTKINTFFLLRITIQSEVSAPILTIDTQIHFSSHNITILTINERTFWQKRKNLN